MRRAGPAYLRGKACGVCDRDYWPSIKLGVQRWLVLSMGAGLAYDEKDRVFALQVRHLPQRPDEDESAYAIRKLFSKETKEDKEICVPCALWLVSLEDTFDHWFYDLAFTPEAIQIVRRILVNETLRGEAAKFAGRGEYLPAHLVVRLRQAEVGA